MVFNRDRNRDYTLEIAGRFQMRELPGSSRKWVLKYPLNENRDPNGGIPNG